MLFNNLLASLHAQSASVEQLCGSWTLTDEKEYLLKVPAVLLKELLTKYFSTSAAVSAGCTALIPVCNCC